MSRNDGICIQCKGFANINGICLLKLGNAAGDQTSRDEGRGWSAMWLPRGDHALPICPGHRSGRAAMALLYPYPQPGSPDRSKSVAGDGKWPIVLRPRHRSQYLSQLTLISFSTNTIHHVPAQSSHLRWVALFCIADSSHRPPMDQRRGQGQVLWPRRDRQALLVLS